MEKNTIEKIQERLETLEKRIRGLEQKSKLLGEIPSEKIAQPFDVTDLIALPDHLRQTMIAVIRSGEATAEEIAKKTGRVRNLESSYLNQLVRMGHLKKMRKGRKVYFKPVYVRKALAQLVECLRT